MSKKKTANTPDARTVDELRKMAREYADKAMGAFSIATQCLKALCEKYAEAVKKKEYENEKDKPSAKPEKKKTARKAKAAPKKEAAPKKQAGKRKKKSAVTAPAETEIQENAPTSVRRRTPASVRLTAREITLNVGSSPVKALAERDAKEFLSNPSVFWNRATQFPDPKRYGVQPRVECARVVERTDPKFTRAPWTVSLTVSIAGDLKKAESWGLGVYNKNKGDQE